MMFRRLYWVTEEVRPDGRSNVTGVYTSIPDLVHTGFRGRESAKGLRLTLVKLDCSKAPLGIWESPSFEGLEEQLQQFVSTDEFSAEHCKLLVEELGRLSHASV